jgi:hypothetical protein
LVHVCRAISGILGKWYCIPEWRHRSPASVTTPGTRSGICRTL